MTKFMFSRLLQSAMVLWIVYTATFWLLMATPGNPFVGEKQPPPAVLHALAKRYGLNHPWHAYWAYPWRAITHGDLGPTISYQSWTVLDIIRQTMPVSVALGSMALLLALWIGVLLGTISAVFKGRWPDAFTAALSIAGISVPSFVAGSMLLLFFSVYFSWLPPGGWGRFSQLILPAFTLALGFLAYIARLTRSTMLDTLSADFVRTAKAKGASPLRVVAHHAGANIAAPILAYLGPAAAAILTGSFVVEKIFDIPGMGQNFVNACINKDIPLVLGITMVYTVLIVVFNLLVDVLCARADPRIALR